MSLKFITIKMTLYFIDIPGFLYLFDSDKKLFCKIPSEPYQNILILVEDYFQENQISIKFNQLIAL